MAKSAEEFHALMRRVLSGSDEAAQELFRDYEPYLLHAIRRRLNKRMRSKFDSLDFAQDVWASFFADPSARRGFETSEELVAFLTRLAKHKVIDAVRQRLTTEQHDLHREKSLDDSRQFDKDKLPGNQPTPSQIMMTQEEWKEFLRKQPLVYRRIFMLLREGRTHDEIALEVGIHRRTVDRIILRHAPEASS